MNRKEHYIYKVGRRAFLRSLYLLPLTFLACSTSEIDLTADQVEQEIETPVAFGYYTGSNQVESRANTDYFVAGIDKVTAGNKILQRNQTIPEGKSIGVFGYYTGRTLWQSDSVAPSFMYNVPMTVGGSTETPVTLITQGNPDKNSNTTGETTGLHAPLTYSPVRYWPNTPNDKVSFVAYYPFAEQETIEGSTYKTKTEMGIETDFAKAGIGSFKFTMQEKPEDHIDFLVSDIVRDVVKPAINDKVLLNFHHALAQVAVRLQPSAEMTANGGKIENVNITLSGMETTGTCTPTLVDGDTKLVWSNLGGTKTIKIGDFALDDPETDSPYYQDQGHGDKAIALIIPQQLNSTENVLYITYDLVFYKPETDTNGNVVKNADGSTKYTNDVEYAYRDLEYTHPFSYTVNPEESPNNREFLAGKIYTYLMTISPNEIIFSPSLSPWYINTFKVGVQ